MDQQKNIHCRSPTCLWYLPSKPLIASSISSRLGIESITDSFKVLFPQHMMDLTVEKTNLKIKYVIDKTPLGEAVIWQVYLFQNHRPARNLCFYRSFICKWSSWSCYALNENFVFTNCWSLNIHFNHVQTPFYIFFLWLDRLMMMGRDDTIGRVIILSLLESSQISSVNRWKALWYQVSICPLMKRSIQCAIRLGSSSTTLTN